MFGRCGTRANPFLHPHSTLGGRRINSIPWFLILHGKNPHSTLGGRQINLRARGGNMFGRCGTRANPFLHPH
jgi:hypothetical protein